MMVRNMNWYGQLDRNGYSLLERVYSSDEVRDAIERLVDCLRELPASSASVRSRDDRVYALRNLLELFPYATEIWNRRPLTDLLRDILGDKAGLVRGLFFDKPPEKSWSLPWHKDLTIAVRDNRLNSSRFRHPTRKAGVPHVEAPKSVLDSMLTLRIHLDDATEENGALRVIPGSHHSAEASNQAENIGKLITADAGDVLAMRPLLSHCSGTSHPGTQQHRRVIHLEFAADQKLPEGFEWHFFRPICCPSEKTGGPSDGSSDKYCE